MEQYSHLTAAVLGSVQGLTEFLPVSSSGHLIVISWLMEGKPLPLAINTALHFGTLLAVLVYCWRDWLALAQGLVREVVWRQPNFHARVLFPALVLGSIPAGVIGLLGKDAIEATFHNPASVIVPLFLVGFLLWYADRKSASRRDLSALSVKDGILIGVAQAFALIPGVSRSGATITCGRFLQLHRADAARFSFLLGTPAMAGAALLQWKDLAASIQEPIFYIGVGSSCLVGCLAMQFFLNFIKKFGFLSFALYRAVLALVIGYLYWAQTL